MNADQWNVLHPIGTLVRYWTGVREGEGRMSRTRSHAWHMGTPDGPAVVKVNDHAGGIALTHVEVVPDGGASLVNLLVEHSPCYNHRGYVIGCDGCDDGPYPEAMFVGDPGPLTRWAEHIAALCAQKGVLL